MIEERATIISCDAGYAVVETQRKTSCGACSMNKACGTGVLAKVFKDKVARLRVKNTIEAAVGEEVIVGVEEAAMVRGSFLVYMLPLLMLILFALLGEEIARQLLIGNVELVSIGFALFGLFIALWWVRRHTSNNSAQNRYQAVILRRS